MTHYFIIKAHHDEIWENQVFNEKHVMMTHRNDEIFQDYDESSNELNIIKIGQKPNTKNSKISRVKLFNGCKKIINNLRIFFEII